MLGSTLNTFLGISLSLIIAGFSIFNVAILFHLYTNGRRLSGIVDSIFRIIAYLFLAVALKTGIVGVIELPVLIVLLSAGLSVIRRTWMLLRDYHAMECKSEDRYFAVN